MPDAIVAPDNRERLPEICYAGNDERERERSRICSRLLLYLRGLDVTALSSLEIVGETMRLTGPDATLEEAFREMHGILRQHGFDVLAPFHAGPESSCVPPVQRASMVSEGIESLSFKRWFYDRRSHPNHMASTPAPMR